MKQTTQRPSLSANSAAGDEAWFASPAWSLQSQHHQGRDWLLLSAGADENYVVDEVERTADITRILDAWQAGTLAALHDDVDCGAAVRQLKRIGALVPARAMRPVSTYELRWLGDPLPGLEIALDALAEQGMGLPRRVPAAEDRADICLLVRTNASWTSALRAYDAAPPSCCHLLVDACYHHALVLGPWVVPGQTACVCCLGNRVLRRWGEAPAPPVPAVQAWPARIAALVAPLLQPTAAQARLLERSVYLDLDTLESRGERVFRLPGCPVCGADTQPAQPLSLPWQISRTGGTETLPL